MRPESVGLVVNPAAGLGARHNLEIARQAVAALGPVRVVTGPGALGGEAAPGAEVVSLAGRSGRAATRLVAAEAAQAGCRAIVAIGGDGTLADVAFALVQSRARCPILGVGAGSTNVGGLVTCLAADVAQLAHADFAAHTVAALTAGCNESLLALAFNDVVIGTTVVGTLHGEVVDLDAAERLDGRTVVAEPQPVGRAGAEVIRISPGRVVKVAAGLEVGTVVAGFADGKRFYGKAIAGAVCLTGLAGLAAGCLVCDRPLVRTRLEAGELVAVEPLRSAYVSLADSDTLQVTGVGPPAVLCADGNPLKRLEPEDRVHIRVRTTAVEVLRPLY